MVGVSGDASARGAAASPPPGLAYDALGAEAETATLLNPDTGATVRVPAALLRLAAAAAAPAPADASAGAGAPAAAGSPPTAAGLRGLLSARAASAQLLVPVPSPAPAPAGAPSAREWPLAGLRRRLRAADVQAGWSALGEGDIAVDAAARTYRLARYPPLAFFVHSAAYVVFGAFLVAAAAQVSVLVPCYGGQVAVATAAGKPFCVAAGDAAALPSPLVDCPAAVCVPRIPVTMQTYAVLLNGALAGRTGALATALYVLMVCVGAPFQAGGKAQAVWLKGAIIGPSGGFFVGFIAASYIMGICAEWAHDRPTRRVWRMVAWMFAAEAAIYFPAVVWFPFGLAISTGKPVSALCPSASPSGVSACLSLIFQALFVPYIPGDLFKMALVVATVPLAWMAVTAWHRWRHADSIRRAAVADRDDDGGEAGDRPAAQQALPQATPVTAMAPAAADVPDKFERAAILPPPGVDRWASR